MYTLKIGTRGTFSVASFKEASAKYAEVRDASGVVAIEVDACYRGPNDDGVREVPTQQVKRA